MLIVDHGPWSRPKVRHVDAIKYTERGGTRGGERRLRRLLLRENLNPSLLAQSRPNRQTLLKAPPNISFGIRRVGQGPPAAPWQGPAQPSGAGPKEPNNLVMSSLEVFNRGTTHGEESKEAQVFQKLRQRREERNAPLQEGHCKKRQRRQGWQSQKQKTGDRYRIVESPQEGEESAEETIAIEEAGRTAQRKTGRDVLSIERLVRAHEKAFTQPLLQRSRRSHCRRCQKATRVTGVDSRTGRSLP
jgi:hypothetical protein